MSKTWRQTAGAELLHELLLQFQQQIIPFPSPRETSQAEGLHASPNSSNVLHIWPAGLD